MLWGEGGRMNILALFFFLFMLSFQQPVFAQLGGPPSSLGVNQPDISYTYASFHNLLQFKNLYSRIQLLKVLMNDIGYYKTTNSGFHAGHLLHHSLWVEQTIAGWCDEGHFWCQGPFDNVANMQLSKHDCYLAAVAGFLHDIGKAGGYRDGESKITKDEKGFVKEIYYFTKEGHSQVGFEYLMGMRPYQLVYDKSFFGFDDFFKALGIDPEERKLIAIVVGMHWNFGIVMVKAAQEGKNLEKASDKFLTQLQSYVDQAGYDDNEIDERIVRIAVLVGAADVKGSQPSIGGKTILFDTFIEMSRIYPTSDKYQTFDFEQSGKRAFAALLTYFREKWKTKRKMSKVRQTNEKGVVYVS